MMVSLEHLARQLDRFSADDPHERCAMVFHRRRSGLFLIEVPNTHPEPWHSFSVAKSDAREVIAKYTSPGVVCVGVLHTHPSRRRDDFVPSARDHTEAFKLHDMLFALWVPAIRTLVRYDGVMQLQRTHIPPRRLRKT